MNGIWIVLAVFFALVLLRRGGQASAKVVAELRKQDALVVDVRTAEEFRGGHAAEAIHIPLADLGRGIRKRVTDKGRPVLLYCASGARSGAGKKLLEQLGFTNVHNLGSLARARALLKAPAPLS